MFCSATPQLMKREGWASLNLSNSLLPMSPDSMTMRGSSLPSLVSPSAKAFLIFVSPASASGEPELLLSLDHFLGRRRAVVPVVVVFHEGDALALHRVRNEGDRLARAIGDVAHQLR